MERAQAALQILGDETTKDPIEPNDLSFQELQSLLANKQNQQAVALVETTYNDKNVRANLRPALETIMYKATGSKRWKEVLQNETLIPIKKMLSQDSLDQAGRNNVEANLAWLRDHDVFTQSDRSGVFDLVYGLVKNKAYRPIREKSDPTDDDDDGLTPVQITEFLSVERYLAT